MSTEELRSRLWSCSDLSEAIEIMDKTSTMPSDPQELLKLAKDLKRLAEKAKAEIAEAETLPAQDDALPKVEPGVKVEQEGLPEIDPAATWPYVLATGDSGQGLPGLCDPLEDEDWQDLFQHYFVTNSPPPDPVSTDAYQEMFSPEPRDTYASPLGKLDESTEDSGALTTTPGSSAGGLSDGSGSKSATSGAAKRNHELIASLGLIDENDLEFWRGKFRRTCEPKRASGNLEIPDDIFQQYQSKGASRDKLFELFVKSGGDKDSFIQEVRVERSCEQVNELNREGGFYTEKEMKDILKFPESKIRSAVERGERDPTYMELDELDENIVYYWCNVRTRGNLKNRHAQGLHVSTTAQGNTDRFKSQLMSNKFDLASMGHHGPAKKEQKAVKTHELDSHMEEVLNVLNKMAPFLDKLHASTAKGAPEAHTSVAALYDKMSKLYDNMTEISADLKVGDVNVDSEEMVNKLKKVYAESKRLLSTWTATEKKFRTLARRPRAAKEKQDEE